MVPPPQPVIEDFSSSDEEVDRKFPPTPPHAQRVVYGDERNRNTKLKYKCLVCSFEGNNDKLVDARPQNWESHIVSSQHKRNLQLKFPDEEQEEEKAARKLREKRRLEQERDSRVISTRSKTKHRFAATNPQDNGEEIAATSEEKSALTSVAMGTRGNANKWAATSTSGDADENNDDDSLSTAVAEDSEFHDLRLPPPEAVSGTYGDPLSQQRLVDKLPPDVKHTDSQEPEANTGSANKLQASRLGEMKAHSAAKQIPYDKREPSFDLSKKQIVFLKLSELLDRHRAPLNMHDDIAKFCHEVATVYGFDFSKEKLHCRRAMVNWAQTTYPSTPPMAYTVQLEMPPNLSHRPATATVNFWNFRSQIQDLLSDIDLMGDLNNVVHNPNNPFHPVERKLPTGPEKPVLADEVLEGTWYQETVEMYREQYDFDPDLDFIAPIVIALDRTAVSGNARYGLEPVVLTSAVLRRQIRNKDTSWRHLGLIPDIEENAKAQKRQEGAQGESSDPLIPGRNLRNYLACTEVILRSLIDYQKAVHRRRADYDDRWNLQVCMGDLLASRRTFCPVCFVIIDGSTADELTCRKQVKGDFNDTRLKHLYPDSEQAQQAARKELAAIQKERLELEALEKKNKKATLRKKRDCTGGDAPDAGQAPPPKRKKGQGEKKQGQGPIGRNREEIKEEERIRKENLKEVDEAALAKKRELKKQEFISAQGKAAVSLSSSLYKKAMGHVGLELHGRISRGCTCRPDEAHMVADEPPPTEAEEEADGTAPSSFMDLLCQPINQHDVDVISKKALEAYKVHAKAISEKRYHQAVKDNPDMSLPQAERLKIKSQVELAIADLDKTLATMDSSVVELARICQHPTKNVYHEIEYGSTKAGIYSSAPTDVMHAFLEGVLQYCVRTFFSDMVGPTKCGELDRIVNTYFGNLVASQAGLKAYPRTAFRGGLSKTTMMPAHEYQGIALVLALALRDEEVKDLLLDRKVVGRKKKPLARMDHFPPVGDACDQYSEMFFFILSFLRWTREGPFYTDGVHARKTRAAINRLLYWMQRMFPRDSGTGWRLQKMHDCTHLWECIMRFGSPMNFDNGPAEHNHKYLAKLHGRRSQEHGDDLYRKGTARRIAENASIAKALSHCNKQCEKLAQQKPVLLKPSFSVVPYAVVILFHAANKVRVVHLSKTKKGHKVYEGSPPVLDNEPLAASEVPELVVRPETVRAIAEEMKERYAKGAGLRTASCCVLYPECSVPNGTNKPVVFRAHPNFNQNGPWHDWCWIKWALTNEKEEALPFTQEWAATKKILPLGGPDAAGKYFDYKTPGRLTAFVRFSVGETGNHYLSQEEVTIPQSADDTKGIVEWVHEITKREPFSLMDMRCPGEVIIHTTDADYKRESSLGFEFKLETTKQREVRAAQSRHEKKPGHEPKFRCITPHSISQHVFCFEYAGYLKSVYPVSPEVLAVREWEGGFSGAFASNFIDGEKYRIPMSYMRWNPTTPGAYLDNNQGT